MAAGSGVGRAEHGRWSSRGPTLGTGAAAVRQGEGWRLDGTKSEVPVGMVADGVVVSARTEDGGVALFIVDPRPRGHQPAGPGGHRLADRSGDGVLRCAASVPRGCWWRARRPAALSWVLERGATAYCLEMSGACQAAVKLTAAYTTEREQFGKPIATFQAVGQRAADAYIDTEAVRLTRGRRPGGWPRVSPPPPRWRWPSTGPTRGAQRAVHGAQHLHGGVGVDHDYPLAPALPADQASGPDARAGRRRGLRLGQILATEPA